MVGGGLWGIAGLILIESQDSVHSHACGENFLIQFRLSAIQRFTPRLWGKLDLAASATSTRRFTPTPVGKTESAQHGYRPVAVHPHACGENGPTYSLGSMTGRFTPTPVGKTLPAESCNPPTTVHPHAYGENVNQFPQSARRQTVHPHACGENNWQRCVSENSDGSPPRLWGKRRPPRLRLLRRRFTPTPVGKTRTRDRVLTRLTGSPPRLWGKPIQKVQGLGHARFTPTPVGKTRQRD